MTILITSRHVARFCAFVIFGLLLTVAPASAQIPGESCPGKPINLQYFVQQGRVKLQWDATPAFLCPEPGRWELEVGSPLGSRETFVINETVNVLGRWEADLGPAPRYGTFVARLIALATDGVRLFRSEPSDDIFLFFGPSPPPTSCPAIVPTNLRAVVAALGTNAGFPVNLTWSTGGIGIACPPVRYRLLAGLAPGVPLWSFDLGFASRPLTVFAPPGVYYVRVVAVNVGAFGGEDLRASNEIQIIVPGSAFGSPR